MQTFNSAVKVDENHLCLFSRRPEQQAAPICEKISLCRKYLQDQAYARFQEIELPQSVKRQLLLKQIPCLKPDERNSLLKHLPGILPDQRMRFTLASEGMGILSYAQIVSLQLPEQASLELLYKLIDQDRSFTEQGIIENISPSHLTPIGIRSVFKAVARKDSDGLFVQRIFQRISSDLLDQEEQYRCARSCFKIYGLAKSLQTITHCKLSVPVLAACPYLNNLDPNHLRVIGYSDLELIDIYRFWIKQGNEEAVFLAKGKRREWGISQEGLQWILNSVCKVHPRNLVRQVYGDLDWKDQHKLNQIGFRRTDLKYPHSYITLCDYVLHDIELLSQPKSRDVLMPLILRAVEYNKHCRLAFLQLINSDFDFCPRTGELFTLSLSLIKQLPGEELEKYALALLKPFKDTPQLFELLCKLAKKPECHSLISENMNEFHLKPDQIVRLALRIITYGDADSMIELLTVLPQCPLSSDEMIDLFLRGLDRFPELALSAILRLNDYRFEPEARLNFVLEWNERYLLNAIHPLMSEPLTSLPFNTLELKWFFIDAIRLMTVIQLQPGSLVPEKFNELKFSQHMKRDILRTALTHQSREELAFFPFDAFHC